MDLIFALMGTGQPLSSKLHSKFLPPTEINSLASGLAEGQGAEFFPLDLLAMLWRAAAMGRQGCQGGWSRSVLTDPL